MPQKHKSLNQVPPAQPERATRGSDMPETSNTGVYKKVWMFCKSERKRSKGVEWPLIELMSESREKAIKAAIREDEEMWREYGEVNLRAKEVHYHDLCRINFTPQNKDKGTPS